MSWILPVPLLLFAGAMALVPLASLVRRPTSAPWLVVEAVAITVAVILRCGRAGSPYGCWSTACELA